MGRVYQAFDSVLLRHVALKVLPFSNYSDEQFRRFQQEARAAGKLRHPGIVMALDFGVTDRREPFLVMEYKSGETLDVVLETKGRLELDEFKSIFSQITRAMIHAHSEGVIHRDLKPSNILIYSTKEGQKACLLDFGIAKILEDGQSLVNTKTGAIIGSPLYISPEQVSCAELDGRSDVYSLGCVMFEALTGRPPFKGANAMETIQMHVNEEPPRLSERFEGEVSDELEQLLAKALAKLPSQRYQSALELLEKLESLEHRLGIGNDNGEVVESAVPEPDGEEHSKKTIIRLLGLVCIVFLVITLSVVCSIVPLSKEVATATDEEKAKKENAKVEYLYTGKHFDDVVTEGRTLEKESLAALRKPNTENRYRTATAFNLHGTNVSDADLRNLSKFPKVHALSLNNTIITGKGVWHIASKTRGLRVLGLEHVRIDDQDLAEIGKIRTLNRLSVAYNKNLTDDGIKNLAKLPNLVELDVRGTKFTPAGLKFFCQKPNLTILVNDCQSFNGENLKDLAKSAGIKDVKIIPAAGVLKNFDPIRELFKVKERNQFSLRSSRKTSHRLTGSRNPALQGSSND